MSKKSEEIRREKDNRTLVVQATKAYCFLLLNRGKGDDTKESKEGWPTRGL